MYSTTRPLMLMPLKGSRDTMLQEPGEASRNRRPTSERRAAACSGGQRRAKSAPARPARPSPFRFFAFSIDNLQWITLSVARLAQSAERKALNLVVVGSSPTVGVFSMIVQNHSALYTCKSQKLRPQQVSFGPNCLLLGFLPSQRNQAKPVSRCSQARRSQARPALGTCRWHPALGRWFEANEHLEGN